MRARLLSAHSTYMKSSRPTPATARNASSKYVWASMKLLTSSSDGTKLIRLPPSRLCPGTPSEASRLDRSDPSVLYEAENSLKNELFSALLSGVDMPISVGKTLIPFSLASNRSIAVEISGDGSYVKFADCGSNQSRIPFPIDRSLAVQSQYS